VGEIVKIGNETLRKEELDNISAKILEVLKNEKRTYQINKSILIYCLDKLEKEVNSIIFR